jgi:hypothetical protein
VAGTAHARSTGTQDPSIGGQDNQCWGNVASQLAKIGMGDHSKSAKAPGTTFADNPIIGIEEPRNGVGNQSRIPGAPHQTEPGDGGNGVHATNNAILTDPALSPFNGFALDPVTGVFVNADTVNPDHVLTPCEGVTSTLP